MFIKLNEWVRCCWRWSSYVRTSQRHHPGTAWWRHKDNVSANKGMKRERPANKTERRREEIRARGDANGKRNNEITVGEDEQGRDSREDVAPAGVIPRASSLHAHPSCVCQKCASPPAPFPRVVSAADNLAG